MQADLYSLYVFTLLDLHGMKYNSTVSLKFTLNQCKVTSTCVYEKLLFQTQRENLKAHTNMIYIQVDEWISSCARLISE